VDIDPLYSFKSARVQSEVGKIEKHGWEVLCVLRCVCIAASPELGSNGLQKFDDGVVFKLLCGQMLQYVRDPSLLGTLTLTPITPALFDAVTLW